ncbi:MAG TPA: hypothetical protein VEC17_02940 [Candidatus Binatia bacterium]|nr:hypothetical protein [Candidatus Binatia bacterium]
MQTDTLKSSRIAYYTFLIVGLLGLFDIATKSIVRENYEISEYGLVSLGSFMLFRFLFGTSVAATLSAFVNIILSLGLIWIILALLFRKKAKKDIISQHEMAQEESKSNEKN